MPPVGVMILYGILGLVSVGSAVGLLVSRSAIYSALFLVLNFLTVALLYLVLGAPFIALAQVTVYAGAIMVLFLFVIMMLGAEKLGPGSLRVRGLRVLAIVLGVVFAAEAAIFMVVRGGVQTIPVEPTLTFGAPSAVGLTLFNQYSLPFEITSVLLLAAMVGAIVLTRGDLKERQARRAMQTPRQD
ncbi:NADH-quinone oxidoreductase subunit J [bacterium]|nr:MAG: NADH-quinone oxidoreductase subunit J [bacterium]